MYNGENYLSQFQDKKLNQIVIPGSHDAGIYLDENSPSGKTQNLNIFNQATAGCRWFDIRVTGKETANGQVELRAFHSIFKPTTKINMKEVGGTQALDRKLATDFGGKLEDMLIHARAFVKNNVNEFLIFKISKSSNIEKVYDMCVERLGDFHYKEEGDTWNLNTQKVSNLRGKVITLFSEKDCKLIENYSKKRYKFSIHRAGAFPFVELLGEYEIKAYNQEARGLQYYGKYSDTNKVEENVKKQSKRLTDYLKAGNDFNPEAMGVLYWTLTTQKNPTAFTDNNIEDRNNMQMWSPTGIQELKELFSDVVSKFMEKKSKSNKSNKFDDMKLSKYFIPNVVMIDFVSKEKCEEIHKLNTGLV